MASLRRAVRILAAFVAGNFVAVNVLFAGKALFDPSNLHYYSQWEYFGGPVVGYLLLLLLGTIGSCAIALIPTLLVLIFTEVLKIRNGWFFALVSGAGSTLLDVACTKSDLIEARSFCVRLSLGELAVVSIAGIVADYVFWRIAGNRSGEWRARAPQVAAASV